MTTASRLAGWRSRRGQPSTASTTPPARAGVIACVYVAPSARDAGALARLLEAAVAHAVAAGATSLEAIPRGWRPDGGAAAMASLRGALLSAGFEEVDPVRHGVMFRRQL
jgi:GNAT superfamily N-acetyltransferase